MKITRVNMLLYVSLFLSTFLSLSSSSELCNPNDKATLLQIKQSFRNPDLFASWTNNSDCCTSWYHVHCDPTTNRVDVLTVFSGELHGNIPNAIGNLPYLIDLTLRNLPNLTGPIPATITKLVNLQFLRLDSNNLNGPVPSFLSQLKNLYILDLSSNKFLGSIPPSLAFLPKLNIIYLSDNQLTGSIPKSFGSFSNKFLHVSHNDLSGPIIPTSLGRATTIDLSHNQLTGDASFLLINKDKKMINLSWNKLEFNMSKVVFGSSLSIIDLNHNKIYGSIPPSMAGLSSQLQMFNVSYNRLCGQIPTGAQLYKFSKYSYFHNRCLCGTPLPACKIN